MGLYSEVLNKTIIYDCFFFKVNSVLEHPDLEQLKIKRPELFQTWSDLSRDYFEKQGLSDDEYYKKYAPLYPEYSKIVGVTYGMVKYEMGELKKIIKRIIKHDEHIVIERFFNVLYKLSGDSEDTSTVAPKKLAGYNIVYNDIPLLIKRYFINRDKINNNNKELPLILKKYLDLKPWEMHSVVDLANVWNFKGRNIYSLDLIADFLGINKNEKVLSQSEISNKYWNILNNENNNVDALKLIANQGSVGLNIIIQAINLLRSF